MGDEVTKTDAEWREQLTDEQFEVCRNKGTERPFTGKYTDSRPVGGKISCEPAIDPSKKLDVAAHEWSALFKVPPLTRNDGLLWQGHRKKLLGQLWRRNIPERNDPGLRLPTCNSVLVEVLLQ